uniref:SAF domain-containing protein n=1 Tax=Escherichia coli TaxID=562 RepID=UPI0013C58410
AMSEYLDQQEQALRQAAVRPHVERVVAAVALEAGTVLQVAHLAARAYPAELAPSDSLDAARFEDLDGMVLTQALRAGDLITR